MQDTKTSRAADPPTLRWLGDSVVTIYFGEVVSEEIVRQVLALDHAVTERALPGVIETVPSYRALTLHLDPLVADYPSIERHLFALAKASQPLSPTGRTWNVPVHYGGTDGCDLEHVAAHAGLSAAACIEAHAAPTYLVAMIGFLPGFCYLAGLDPQLATPRRMKPRPQIPASSISIGGEQTAIGSVPGPSGWHLIGRTPVRPFQPGRTPTFLFEPGDRIRFQPISATKADQLHRAADRGELIAERDDP